MCLANPSRGAPALAARLVLIHHACVGGKSVTTGGLPRFFRDAQDPVRRLPPETSVVGAADTIGGVYVLHMYAAD